jgi:hypothetical protein
MWKGLANVMKEESDQALARAVTPGRALPLTGAATTSDFGNYMKTKKMDTKIPPTSKNKILTTTNDDTNDNNYNDDDEDIDEIYNEEKRIEYSDATILMIQKSFLEYVDRKSLTICEYLSVDEIKSFLGDS